MAVGAVAEDRVHFPDVGPRVEEGGFSIPLDVVERGLSNLPKDKRVSLQNVAVTQHRLPDKIELTAVDMKQERRVSGTAIKDPFPDWRAVIRRVAGDGSTRICLNRKDLLGLLKALDAACPDKAGDNPIFVEIGEETNGIVVRSMNRETGQHAVGCISSYNVGGEWFARDDWERGIFRRSVKRKKT